VNAQQTLNAGQLLKKKSVIWISDTDNSSCTKNILRILRSDEEVEFRRAGDAAILRSGSEADLVVLDAGHKPEAGLQILMDIKKKLPDVPVLFLSDLDSGVWIAKALRFGARDYIIKSTNIFYIKRIMQNVLEYQRQRSWSIENKTPPAQYDCCG